MALEVLGAAGLLAKAEVCLGETPDASLATSNDGPATAKGTLCLVEASSLAVLSSTPCFKHLGPEASTLEEKDRRGECSKTSYEFKNLFVMVWKHLPRWFIIIDTDDSCLELLSKDP
jgi:hypothetical protein